jgi:enoyl-CoA hydratase/carnithine racemase
VFDYPPFNIVDATMFEVLQRLLARMDASPSLRVVVFESANPEFYLSHFDLTGKIGALPLQGERTPQVLFKQRSLANGQVSPSGKWIAYESAESGRTEIYVRKFRAGAEKWQVSTEGGDHALW